MEKNNGIIIKVGTAAVPLLAIGLVAEAVLSRPDRNAQAQTSSSPSSIEEGIPDENAIPESDSDTEDCEIYVVRKGATLSVIAKACSMEFGRTITVQDIKDANDMEGDVLTPGQELKIPKE